MQQFPRTITLGIFLIASAFAGEVRSGTKIDAQLITEIDASKAKTGDEVAARVTKDVKENGQTTIRKGDRLHGKVKSVESQAGAKGGSSVAVAFDQLVRGESTTELNAVVTQVLSTPSAMRAEPEPMLEPAPARQSSTGRASGGGGLLGGVASTVGGVTSSTVGVASGVGATAGATGQAMSTVATPLRAIRVDSAAGSASTLTSTQGSLLLQSGTRLQLLAQ